MRTSSATARHTIGFDHARSGFRTFSSPAVHEAESKVSEQSGKRHEGRLRHSGQDRRIGSISVPNRGTDRQLQFP